MCEGIAGSCTAERLGAFVSLLYTTMWFVYASCYCYTITEETTGVFEEAQAIVVI